MLLDLVEAFGDWVTDLVDTTDGLEGVNHDGVTETSELAAAFGEGGTAPISNDVQETLEFLQTPAEPTGTEQVSYGTFADAVGDAQPLSEPLSTPVETMPNGMVDYGKANQRLFREFSELSPEELNARVGNLEAQMGAQEVSSDIRSSVGASMDNLAESKAKSFDPTRYTPFETGITLSDSNVPHDPSEFQHHANGILERNGEFYREYGDGTHRPVTSDGKWK
ncbi:hypothetical protein [Natronorubrum bangense]|uniref:Uncharacterized protein n=1 Tax=Natronorubrum bangense JCM 10635 TaxID=1227500 RepID=L9VZJ8_9EURY|nr:hypothetical protein [Natronorubrum bangense]ELY42635.1 hypothetical protein C494_20053 [Natronorubrum bangense JCM 10635]